MIDFDYRPAFRTPSMLAVILAPETIGELVHPALCQVGKNSLLACSLDCAFGAQSVDEIVVVSNDAETLAASNRLCRGPKPVTVVQLEGEFSLPRCLARACDGRILHGRHVAMLGVNSPLRAPWDIDAAAAIFEEALAERDERHPLSLLSMGLFFKSQSLTGMRWIVRDNCKDARLERMKAARARVCSLGEEPVSPHAELASINGALRILTVEALAEWLAEPQNGVPAERIAYIMPEERSIEVENERDLKMAEALLGLRRATTVVAPPLTLV
jgi:CMP-N-acetylneuraminic acid synthetase